MGENCCDLVTAYKQIYVKEIIQDTNTTWASLNTKLSILENQ